MTHEATEAGSGTIERLELAVDALATAYPGTQRAELLGRVRAYLAYLGAAVISLRAGFPEGPWPLP